MFEPLERDVRLRHLGRDPPRIIRRTRPIRRKAILLLLGSKEGVPFICLGDQISSGLRSDFCFSESLRLVSLSFAFLHQPWTGNPFLWHFRPAVLARPGIFSRPRRA